MKRILSMLLALAMALGMYIPAIAAEGVSEGESVGLEGREVMEEAAPEELTEDSFETEAPDGPIEGTIEEVSPEETAGDASETEDPAVPAEGETNEEDLSEEPAAVAAGPVDEPALAYTSGGCGKNGSQVTWNYSNGTLTISGVGDMRDYEDVGDVPWDGEDWLMDIKHVVVRGTVKHIGARAFALLGRLGSVGLEFSLTLEEGITSIGEQAFDGCIIPEVNLPASLTDIGDFALHIETSAINVASGNGHLKSVDGVLFDSSGRTLIKYPWGKKGASYTVPDGVTTIADSACYGTDIINISFPNTLTAIEDYAFQFTGIRELVLPNGLKTLGACAFWGSDLQNVTIPASVTEIDSVAFGLTSPATVTVLSPYCWIASGSDYGTTALGDPEVTVIRGYDGSTAQSHAMQYGFKFESLGKAPSAPPSTDPPASSKSGWAWEGRRWYYYKDGGKIKNQWLQDGGKYYYLDETGAMQTGWIWIDGVWYYANSKGERQYGWKFIDKHWYYLNPVTGQMRTGFYDENGKRYYSGPNWAMKTGWISSGGYWYYASSSGALRTGWVKDGGKWYYLDPADYRMLTGRIEVDGKSYYLNSSGAMGVGWVSIGNGDYYYADRSGALIKNDWVKYRGAWYWLKADGLMARNETLTIDGKNYSFDNSGAGTEVKALYPAIHLQISLYKQNDPRWAGVHLGNSSATIGADGCAVTAYAMVESYRYGQTITPAEMVKRLKFTEGGGMYRPGDYTSMSGGLDLEGIYGLLKQGKPAIVAAKNAAGRQHWVVVTGFKGGDTLTTAGFTVNDPGADRSTLAELFNDRPTFHRCDYYK